MLRVIGFFTATKGSAMPQQTAKPFDALQAEMFTTLGDDRDEAVFLSAIESKLDSLAESLETLSAEWGLRLDASAVPVAVSAG